MKHFFLSVKQNSYFKEGSFESLCAYKNYIILQINILSYISKGKVSPKLCARHIFLLPGRVLHFFIILIQYSNILFIWSNMINKILCILILRIFKLFKFIFHTLFFFFLTNHIFYEYFFFILRVVFTLMSNSRQKLV